MTQLAIRLMARTGTMTRDHRIIRNLACRPLPLPILQDGKVIGRVVETRMIGYDWIGKMEFYEAQPDWGRFAVAPDLAEMSVDIVQFGRRLRWRFWRPRPQVFDILEANVAGLTIVPIALAPWP